MKVVYTIKEFKEERKKLPPPVGFVPTMGHLHAGHIALVRQAKKENSAVVVSIYVNPAQFGPSEDFHTYPRDLNHDLEFLKREDVELVFIPADDEIYPARFCTWVNVEKITERLEGIYRPGHFKGVATIVIKFFNIVHPYRAYFGQKDFQQFVVVKRMTTDLNIETEIVVVPTVREEDGLAMSSRNIYLSFEERKAATILFRALILARQLIVAGEKNAEVIKERMALFIKKEPLAHIDYISVADTETLEEIHIIDRPCIISLAVWIGRTRLIDNMVFE